jgi:hypothetical protein
MLSLPLLLLNFFSSLAFLAYGISCLGTEAMKREFERFRLPNYRVLVGTTQIIGAIALALGPWFMVLGLIATAGLSVQMFAGVIVRIRLRDTFVQTIQALSFFAINLVLFVGYLQNL